jgi:nitroimidazol reductase NimA-like FMN-containing flavoprotein (pyridoxamine 5'-phosphate oxidase superfamily)
MSRRDQIRLTDQEIIDYLKSSRTIILVSNGKDGYPHPMPMWYWSDDEGTVYMTTFRKSQKINNINRDPKVSLLVESGDEYQELKGLLMYSEAEIVDELDYTRDIMFKLSVARGDAQSDQEEMIRGALQKTAEKRVVIRCKPNRIVSWDHGKLGGVY